MSRNFYCSECGAQLVITRMAIPKRAVILDLVELHECGPKVDLEKKFSSNECLVYTPDVSTKTVQKLNELKPSRPFENARKSTAPLDIRDQLNKMISGE